MLTRADFEVVAAKFRKLRPQVPEMTPRDFEVGGKFEGSTPREIFEEHTAKLSEWKFWRNQIADACVEINWRFNRQKFIDETEK